MCGPGVCVCLCLCLSPCRCLSVCVCLCPSVSVCACLPVCLSACLLAWLAVSPSVYRSFVCISVHQPACNGTWGPQASNSQHQEHCTTSTKSDCVCPWPPPHAPEAHLLPLTPVLTDRHQGHKARPGGQEEQVENTPSEHVSPSSHCHPVEEVPRVGLKRVRAAT